MYTDIVLMDKLFVTYNISSCFRLVFKELAKVHLITLRQGNGEEVPRKPKLHRDIEQALDHVPDTFGQDTHIYK